MELHEDSSTRRRFRTLSGGIPAACELWADRSQSWKMCCYCLKDCCNLFLPARSILYEQLMFAWHQLLETMQCTMLYLQAS